MNRTMTYLLAGGEGTRLGAITNTIPKPLVPFAGKYRLIDFPLSNAHNSGVKRIGILVQSAQKSILDYLGKGTSWGFGNPHHKFLPLPSRSRIGKENDYRGTADAVRRNLKLISNDPKIDTVLILSADHIYKMDYNKLIWFHRRNEADVTVAVSRVEPAETHKFGIVHRDDSYRITNWEEKPRQSQGNLASMGIYVFSKEFLLEALSGEKGDDFGRDIIPYALGNGRTVAFEFSGYWRDVGTPDAYWRSTMDLLHPENGLKMDDWDIRSNPGFNGFMKNGSREYIAPSAVISNSYISPDCRVEGRIFNSIVFPGVRIGRNVDIRNSVIMSNCTIASHARIGNTIMCEDVCVGRGAVVGCTDASYEATDLDDLSNNGLVLIGHNELIKPEEWVHKNNTVYTKKYGLQKAPADIREKQYKKENFPGQDMLSFGTT